MIDTQTYEPYFLSLKKKSSEMSFHELIEELSHSSVPWDAYKTTYLNKCNDYGANKNWDSYRKMLVIRDAFYFYLPLINKGWIEQNHSLIAHYHSEPKDIEKPVIFLGYHSVFQTILPIILSYNYDSLSPIVLDSRLLANELYRFYLQSYYDMGLAHMHGGKHIPVGIDNTSELIDNAIKEHSKIFSALDIFPDVIKQKEVIEGMSIATGLIKYGVSINAEFYVSDIQWHESEGFLVTVTELEGKTCSEISSEYMHYLKSIISEGRWDGILN